jgi:hypothetical protein
MFLRLTSLCSVLCLLPLSRAALACGGRYDGIPHEVLLPASWHLQSQLGSGDDPYWGVDDAGLTSFLYPLRPTDPALYTAVDQALQYGEEPQLTDPELEQASADYQAAWGSGRLEEALAAAARVVERQLDLPALLAQRYAPALREPVELLELAPALRGLSAEQLAAFRGGSPHSALLQQASQVRGLDPSQADALLAQSPQHPRLASLQWLSLRHALASELADGWTAEQVAEHTDAATFEALLAQADAWLARHPGHPLADHVRLKKLRVNYLRGDAARAWAFLFELYERHPVRAAYEMRFLLAQGLEPAGLEPDKLSPELLAAMMPWLSPTPAQWSRWWKRAAGAEGPGALALQERLLLQLAQREGELALRDWKAFPRAAAAPSETWAELRLVALMQARRYAEARAQASRLPQDSPFAAKLRAQLCLLEGDWSGALLQPGLPPEASAYLVRVLAPEPALEQAATSGEPTMAWEASLALATRSLATTGDWLAGARWLEPVDPGRAALWREASDLARDERPQGKLLYARFLVSHAGAIFIERDRSWYRGLPLARGQPYAVPLEAQAEQEAIDAWLQRSFATWKALGAYADWLGALEVAKLSPAQLLEAQAVLREADDAYNALLNYDSIGGGYAWGRLLPGSEPARTVRQVGKELRARLARDQPQPP